MRQRMFPDTPVSLDRNTEVPAPLHLSTFSMAKGKVGEISDQTLVDDLLNAGYIIPYEATKEVHHEEIAEKPKTKRKGKA